jgi:hypothetical protein
MYLKSYKNLVIQFFNSKPFSKVKIILLFSQAILVIGCHQPIREKCIGNLVSGSSPHSNSNSTTAATPTSNTTTQIDAKGLFDFQDNSTGCPFDSNTFRSISPNRLQFFGYMPFLMDGIGNLSDLDAVKSYSNLIFIAGSEIPKLAKINQINTSEHKKLKALLANTFIFFDANLNLRTDYKQSWAEWAAKIQPYSDMIAAIYPIDEPFLASKSRNISVATMVSDLEKINIEIKKSFPKIPIAVTFSAVEMYYSDFQIPKGFDWVSFDCYGSWTACGDKGESIPELFQTLKNHMTPNQKSLLVVDATARKSNLSNTNTYINALKNRAEMYYQLCNLDSSCIGLMPFSYQTVQEWYGASELGNLTEKLAEIGKRIIETNN